MNFDSNSLPLLDTALLEGLSPNFVSELFNDENLVLDASLPTVKLEDVAYDAQNYPEQQQQQLQQQIVHPQVQQPPPQQNIEQHDQQQNLHCSQIYTNELPGPYDFEVFINPHHGKKSPWMYSSALNKVFIAINLPIRIDFKCKFPEDDKKLFIRATPIYSQAQFSMNMVTRCINHASAAEQTNKNYLPNVWDHVLRCNHRNAYYGGSIRDRQHLYVRVPLGKPPAGIDSTPLQYQFMCKNSCGSETGMNRRPIDVVFTLEDENEDILGRRVLSVRICSCPKRDKDKDEADYYKKDGDEPRGKKRKLEKKSQSSQEMSDNNKIFKLELNVPGQSHIIKAAYKAVYGMLATEMMLTNGDQTTFKKCMQEIKQKMGGPVE